MKTLAAVLLGVWLMTMSGAIAEPRDYKQGDVILTLLSEAPGRLSVLTRAENAEATHVIVRVFYRAKVEGIDVVLSKFDVVPAMGMTVPVLAGPFAIDPAAVAFVRVNLVRSLAQEQIVVSSSPP